MRRKEVLYAMIGGVVGGVLVMATGWLSPLGAHSKGEVHFEDIRCRQLVVDYPNGMPAILISAVEDGGSFVIMGKNGGGVWIESSQNGGSISVTGADGKSKSRLNVGDIGATVSAYYGKSGAVMSAIETRGGEVQTLDKNGYRLATLE